MYRIKRTDHDPEYGKMEGYYTGNNEYGTLAEAYEYDSYDEAVSKMESEREYYTSTFPETHFKFRIEGE